MRYDIEVAKLASERAAAVVLWKMGRGRSSLAAIASTASLVGILAAVMELVVAVRSMFVERSMIGCLSGGLGEVFVTPGMGILVAILALWCRWYLCSNLEALDTEMRAATLEMASFLSLRQRN